MNELTLSNKSVKPNSEFTMFLTSASSIWGKIEANYLQLGLSLAYTKHEKLGTWKNEMHNLKSKGIYNIFSLKNGLKDKAARFKNYFWSIRNHTLILLFHCANTDTGNERKKKRLILF